MSSVSGGIKLVTATAKPGKRFFVNLPVVIYVLLSVSVCSGSENKSVPVKEEGNNGTFSQSPTNHEEVLARNKVVASTSSNDDYWVGTHKLEFRPHPLLMPSTQSPTAQIPIPIIELGLPPTLSPEDFSDDDSSEEEEKSKKGKRKSRDRRKKSRDQRRLSHRTLWQNSSSLNVGVPFVNGVQQNSQQLLQQQQQQFSNLQPTYQQSPIITASNISPFFQNTFVRAATPSRNDDSFHGTATTWSINHPGNNVQNLYPTSNSGSGGVNENPNPLFQQQQTQYPRSASIQSIQFGYPQFQPQQTQQLQQQPSSSNNYPSQPTQQISVSSAPQPFHLPPLSGPDADFLINSQQQSPFGPPPPIGGNNGGPFVVYVSSSDRGMAHASASGPIPVRAFNSLNEIPMDMGMKPHIQYNPPSGYFSGPTGNYISHSNSQSGSSNNNNGGSNPQYMRNNFLRMVMDRLASVGKMLPIPFVTKYSHSSHSPQGYNRPGQLSRRM